MDTKKDVVIIYYMEGNSKYFVAASERRNHKDEIVPRITEDYTQAMHFDSDGEANQNITQFHDRNLKNYKTEWISVMKPVVDVKHHDTIRIF